MFSVAVIFQYFVMIILVIIITSHLRRFFECSDGWLSDHTIVGATTSLHFSLHGAIPGCYEAVLGANTMASHHTLTTYNQQQFIIFQITDFAIISKENISRTTFHQFVFFSLLILMPQGANETVALGTSSHDTMYCPCHWLWML